jgi:hypothetical protein
LALAVCKEVPQMANPQICGLQKFVRFAELQHMWQFTDWRLADPIPFSICGFAIFETKLFLRNANPQINNSFLQNTDLKCSNSTVYLIIKNVGRTNLQPNFRWFYHEKAEKVLNVLKEVFHHLCPMMKNLRISDLRTGTPKKLAVLRFEE